MTTNDNRATPGQQLARLKVLTGEAGKNHFERIGLAASLLDNKDWLSAQHGGDQYHAAEWLEADFFHDLCGAISIWDLLTVLRKFPEEADWAARKHNIGKMLEECREAKRQAAMPAAPRKVVKIVEFEKVKGQLEAATYDVRVRDKQIKTKDKEIQELRERVSELEKENAKLTGRIDELERLLHRKFTKAGMAFSD